MRMIRLALAACTTLLAGLALTAAPASADSATGDGAAGYAVSKIGAPYQYGAAGPDRFDNPGLVKAAYGSVGVDLPQNTSSLYVQTQRIGAADLALGDLVFYGTPGTSPTSVAIYEGNGTVINAGRPGTTVDYHPLGTSTVFGYGRVV
jgi:cell wall-associated NlpC family hydrolase